MRTNGTTSLGGLSAVIALTILLVGQDVGATWPPEPNSTAVEVADPQNWPNDPLYGYSATSNGQWMHYGFMPPAESGTVRRAGETAAGMSVDLAWRISIGNPRIIIAITDTGVLWDEPDLIDKIFLNHGELGSHKPRHADQSACGGSGVIAGFDCDGDDAFTMRDYAESLSVESNDANGNGVLDPGDLIVAFSDGIDEDVNGYADDIAGWDFMKDDNNPFDDTQNGHGTREALVAAASTNNGISGAGVCPGCTILPLRVADSLNADAQDFAQAIVYATDNGSRVIASALDTPNMSGFAAATLDYARTKNVLVVTATSVGGSRAHDLPATSNHTLPVHALGFDGASAATSSTFQSAKPCANYGGQQLLSASSDQCGEGVAGAIAGVAGLMLSTALEYGPTPSLTVGELQALMVGTADDVADLATTPPGLPGPTAQPGFDERFGYGRINATRAVEAIVNQRIPPQVSLTSPSWFEPLYADLVGSPIELHGSIAAPRANAYDYVVEWARGAQPIASAFDGHVLAKAENVDPTVTIGGGSDPLALLDVRNVNAVLQDDPFVADAHDARAVTVRVRAIAHYGGDIGDIHAESRRTYFVHTDPDLAPGFPLRIADSIESSPKMADIDGDGIRDLVVLTGGGQIHAFALTSAGPMPLPGFPFQTNIIHGLNASVPTGVPNYTTAPAYASGEVDLANAREGFVNAPAIADLDGDGSVEIVASSFAGTIYVVQPDGSSRPGFPVALPRISSCNIAEPTVPCMDETNRLAQGTFASPVLVDLDGNATLDIVQAAFDGQVHAFDHEGKPIAGYPVDVHYAEAAARNRLVATPAAGDFDGNGSVDLVVGSNEQLGLGGEFGAVYLLDGRGNMAPTGPVFPRWPIIMTSTPFSPIFGEGAPNAPVIARFADQLATVVHAHGGTPFVLPRDPGPQASFGSLPEFALPNQPNADSFGSVSNVPQPNEMVALLASPSLGDVDQDGIPDVVTVGGSKSLLTRLQQRPGPFGDHLLAAWSGATGAMLPGSPFVLDDFSSLEDHAIADLDGDDYPEIIGGTSGYFLHAFDGCGREPAGFPKFTGQWIAGTPAVGDLDGDGLLELAVGTRSGLLYVWRTRGTTDGVIAWESYHHDNRNTGNLEEPLTQGTLLKAVKPLVADACHPPVLPPTFQADGGCVCTVASRGGSTAPLALFIGGTALALTRRRKRR